MAELVKRVNMLRRTTTPDENWAPLRGDLESFQRLFMEAGQGNARVYAVLIQLMNRYGVEDLKKIEERRLSPEDILALCEFCEHEPTTIHLYLTDEKFWSEWEFTRNAMAEAQKKATR